MTYEWNKLRMQGSDLEKVGRKYAELEFSIREREKMISQNYSNVQNKLENGQEDTLDLLDMQEKLQ